MLNPYITRPASDWMRDTICLLALLVLVGLGSPPTQAQTWQWVKPLLDIQNPPQGGSLTDIYDAATDNAGNTLLVGRCQAPMTLGTTTLPVGGFLAKVSSIGTWQWAITCPTAYDSRLAVDATGAGYLSSSFSGTVMLGSTTLTGGSSFVAKCTGAGTWQWAAKTSAAIKDVGVDAVGLVYTTGSMPGSFPGGATNHTFTPAAPAISLSNADQYADLFVGQLSSAGIWQWVQQGVGTTEGTGTRGGLATSPPALTVDPSGAPIITGSFAGRLYLGGNNYITTGLGTTSIGEAFVIKFTPAGVWRGLITTNSSSTSGGNSLTELYSITTEPSGDVIVSGSFVGRNYWYSTSQSSSYRGFIARLSGINGTVMWARDIRPGNGTFRVAGMQCTSTNLYFSFSAPGLTLPTSTLPTAGQYDAYIVRTRLTDGVDDWGIGAGGADNDNPTSLGLDGAGNLYLTGAFSPVTTYGTQTLTLPYRFPAIARAGIAAVSPTVTSFTPASGTVGSTVIITGTGFTGVTSVTFNGVPAPGFLVTSPTSITILVPVGATSGTIGIVTAAGTVSSTARYTVTTATPATSGRPAVAFSVFPNPTRGKATVQLPAQGARGSVQVLDLLGRPVRRYIVPAQAEVCILDLTDLPAGQYVIRCGAATAPLVVE